MCDDWLVAVMDDLGIVFVETVLLSISLCEAEEEVPVERLLPYWLVLEDMVVAEKVMSIGIADLDKKKLEHLCEMAQVCRRSVWCCGGCCLCYGGCVYNDYVLIV